MPPKPKAAGPSKKTEQKKKEKIIEDKTFGLKNKKGAKTQKFIQQVQNQVKHGNQPVRKVDEVKKADATKKDDKKKEQAELNQLFRPVTTQKVEKGVDPKSVLCAFYKQGNCGKGDKCKFSHDCNIERKSHKRSVYVDMRDEGDGIESWGEDKLKEVIEKKHGESDKRVPKTEIICKYFITALEQNKYGWFWECPNGEKCVYRHALPPGFVLKKDQKKEKETTVSIEDLVEKERSKLSSTFTKITLETFLAWKKRKIREKEETMRKEEAFKKAEFKAGKSVGLSGREMFTFRPELANEDLMEEGEATIDSKLFQNDENDEEDYVQTVYKELTLESLANEAREVDGTGTIFSGTRQFNSFNNHVPDNEGAVGGEENGNDSTSSPDVPIDENLFVDDEDLLDELEEDLQDLEIPD